jgi:glyoxylase-like metal-dependent hydrolase (beta-lactamase superfamily II)
MRPLLFGIAAMIIAAPFSHTTMAEAVAARQKSQAAGYYRMSLGDFEITALSDGTFPTQTNTPAAATSVNAYLVKTGDKLLLIDTGTGTLLGPGLGKLVGNLRAAGYQPEQVDEIYITHMQPDHIGGLLWERKAAFPNAIVRASRAEADYWLAKSSMAAAPIEQRQRFAQVAAALKPYILAGHLKTFDGQAELVPGIRALPNAEPTPGHTIYTVESEGKKIIFGGDTLHVAAGQFRDAAAAIRVDVDAVQSLVQHTALLTDAAAHGYWLAGAHLSFPGIGHVRTSRHGFEFVPAT